ncbi:hypothetical protein FJ444_02855 [Aestuariibacter sp. GS-14]|uniref:SUMF1/EgtB/PvdO family nonheme iron enzyme n=1 Tax=Aestuariibacter sp. GS-14 TaxID=2590670 RepID=UPI001125C254|nr:SUMF1/EgtB/PvdO family nonheme iron enzyme [Aestuariibacter sp. GS-14]TPV62222.1 hypothetical protein FJ444_02855 [Aestuariibacter sp. GS-14]
MFSSRLSKLICFSIFLLLDSLSTASAAKSAQQDVAELRSQNNQLNEQLFNTRSTLIALQAEVIKVRIELKNLDSEYDLARELVEVDSDYIDIVNDLKNQKDKLETLLSVKSRLLVKKETELNTIATQIGQNEKQLEVYAVRYGTDIGADINATPMLAQESSHELAPPQSLAPEPRIKQNIQQHSRSEVVVTKETDNILANSRFSATKYSFGEQFPTFIEITSIDQQFRLGVSDTEITVEQFQLFQSETRYRSESQRSGGCNIFNYETKRSKQANSESPGYRQTNTHPIVCVSLFDAIKYTQWLSKKLNRNVRLPTRSEWFTFATPHEMIALEKQNGMTDNCLHANIRDQAFANKFSDDSTEICNDRSIYPEPVKMKLPSSLGLYNLYGNAREWTMSCWDDAIKNLWVCPAVHIAGGSAYFKLNPAKETRGGPDGVSNDVSFRVVYEL